eukprot:gene34499-42545_t
MQPGNKRPSNWRDIAHHYETTNSVTQTSSVYPVVCEDGRGGPNARCKPGTIEMRLKRWKEDLDMERDTNVKTVVNVGGRKVPYGDDIDLRLLEKINHRIAHGEPVDSDTIRALLIIELKQEGLLSLLKENGGENVFSKSWAQRFFQRHNLSVKLLTVRPKYVPADHALRQSEYETSLALALDSYAVPPCLVVSLQEVTLNFVPNTAQAKAKKSDKKIKTLGMVKNKATMTTTLAATEEGHVLPPQMIFMGHTERCHPLTTAPMEGVYFHSANTMHTVETMIDFCDKILRPYRELMIRQHKLSPRQHLLLKCSADAALAHCDEHVLQHYRKHCIIPVFYGEEFAPYWSELQVAAVRLFRSEAKIAFRDHVHADFHQFLSTGRKAEDYCLDVKLSTIKNFIPDFIARGLASLHTPEMRDALQEAFRHEGRFEVCRTQERAAAARLMRAASSLTGTENASLIRSAQYAMQGDAAALFDQCVRLPVSSVPRAVTATPVKSSAKVSTQHHQQNSSHHLLHNAGSSASSSHNNINTSSGNSGYYNLHAATAGGGGGSIDGFQHTLNDH